MRWEIIITFCVVAWQEKATFAKAPKRSLLILDHDDVSNLGGIRVWRIQKKHCSRENKTLVITKACFCDPFCLPNTAGRSGG